MEPYQRAAEEGRRQGEFPITAIKKAGSLALSAGGAYLGGKAAGVALEKVAPFLSKYVPEGLAIKGLSKLDPRWGKFISKAMSAGKSFDEVKDFISSKMDEQALKEEGEPKSAPAQEKQNLIEKHSPELHQFILQQIKRGRKPLEAAALVSLPGKVNEKFKGIINKIVKDAKMDWVSLVQSIYGTEALANPESKAALQEPQSRPKKEKLIDMLDRQSKAALQSQNPSPQRSSLSPAIQAAVDKIMQM